MKSKELEAWERIETTVERSDGDADITNCGDLGIIENVIKALEIIKENIGLKMNVDEDVACLYVPLDKDNICIAGYVIGKEKIDILKKVLL